MVKKSNRSLVLLYLFLALTLTLLAGCTSSLVEIEDTGSSTDSMMTMENERYGEDVTNEAVNEEKQNNDGILLVGAQIEVRDKEDNVVISKEQIDSSELRKNDEGLYEIIVKLTPEGKQLFATATEKNIGKRLQILIDGKVVRSLVVQQPVSAGIFWINDVDHDAAYEIMHRFAVFDKDGYINNEGIINYGKFWPDGYNFTLEKGDNWMSFLRKYDNAGRFYYDIDGEWVEHDGTKFKVNDFYVSDALVLCEPHDFFYIGKDGKKSGLGVQWYDFSWDRSLRLANAYPGTTNVRELNQANCYNGDLCLAIGYSQFLEIFGENQFEVIAEMTTRDNPSEGHEFIEYLELTHKESGISARLRNYYTQEETASKCSYCVAISVDKINTALYNAITLLQPYATEETIMHAIEMVNYGKNDEAKVQFDGYYDIMTAYVRDGMIYIYNETWGSHEWNSGFSFR